MENINKFKDQAKLLGLSLLLGVIGGGVGAAFSLAIGFVTSLRSANGWLICLLPVFAVLIVFIYQKLGINGMGINQVFESADGENKLSPKLTVGMFIAPLISHLFGASVGREGAALQLGSGIATGFSKIFHLDDEFRHILIRAGMAALFSAVFGTPFTAFIFVLEVVCVGTIHFKSAIPSLIASYSAYITARFIGAEPEVFLLNNIPSFNIDTFLKILAITILTALLSIVFCYSLRYCSKFAKQLIKNDYLRIVIGGVIIVLLTFLIGNQDYNGAGINVIGRIFNSIFIPYSTSFKPEAFVLKLLFTCISVAAGFKGGEIVPTLFIGATFGAFIATLLGLAVPFGAALGMILLFCGVTNCPLASLFLAVELFSGVGVWYFVPSIALCFLISGKISLYSAQNHKFKYI